jgi:outer membrane protein, multidrug efflux system
MYNNFFYTFIFLVLLSGCKSQLETLSMNNKLPEIYVEEIEEKKLNLPEKSAFFTDSILINIINVGIEKNFDVLSAVQRVQEFQSYVIRNKGVRMPDLTFGGNIGQRRFGRYTMDGVGNYDTNFSPNISEKQKVPDPLPDFNLGLYSQWEIDIWGKLKHQKKAAFSRWLASENGKNFVITSVVGEIANKYYEILSIKAEILIVEDYIKLQEDALEVVKIIKEVGRANGLAVEIMEGRLFNTKSQLLLTQQKLQISENQMNFLLGNFPGKLPINSTILQQTIPNTITSGVPSELLNKRPDIKQAEQELIASQADVFSAKTAFYPSLNISGSLGLQAFNSALLLEIPASTSYQLLGGITAPLLNRRFLKAQLLTTQTAQNQALINYERTVVNGFKEVYDQMVILKNTESMITLKNLEVKTFKNSISISKELFKSGKASYLEIINAQQNYLNAQLEFVDLKMRQMQSSVNLYRSLGGGLQ